MKLQTRAICGLLSNYYDLPRQVRTEHNELQHPLTALYGCMSAVLEQLSQLDRQILQLLHMGPQNPRERVNWNGQYPTAAAVCAELGLTESQLRTRHYRALKLMQAAVFGIDKC